MKIVTWLAILLLTTGCANMTQRETQTAYIVGGIVVAAIIISASSSHGHEEKNCFFTGPGSGRTCTP